MFKSVQGLFSSMLPALSAPPKHEATITALIIPADGSPPRLTRIKTIDVLSEGNIDYLLHHVPDMRSFWGSKDGWAFRDIARIDIANHAVPGLNGCYFGWKSFDMDGLPANKHVDHGIRGDACIVKMAPEKYNERGSRIIRIKDTEIVDFHNKLGKYAVYDDIPKEVIEMGLWKEILAKLADV